MSNQKAPSDGLSRRVFLSAAATGAVAAAGGAALAAAG